MATKPELLLATNNRGKLAELRLLLSGLPYRLLSPDDIGLKLDVAETGATYAANASLKAREFARASGRLTLADDSGLEVEVLGGAPGVLSARYAGPGANDSDRVAFLLDQIKDIPLQKRCARFRCIIAISSPDGKVRLCSGSCGGFIALTPHGSLGFGYDPIFYFPKFNKTMAEIPVDLKNRISHRARAARQAGKILLSILPEMMGSR
jgi:XTP/dITP diphosphohydrolase